MAREDLENLFIDRYFECGFNATEAIQSIKNYKTRNTAQVEGHRMLVRPRVREEVERRLVEYRAKRRMTVEQFGDLLLEAATVDVVDFYDEEGKLKPLSEIPPHARKQIASIEPVVIEVVRMEPHPKTGKLVRVIATEVRHKVKVWDLRKAQELWGKWKKMYTDKTEIAGADGGPLRVSVNINGVKR